MIGLKLKPLQEGNKAVRIGFWGSIPW